MNWRRLSDERGAVEWAYLLGEASDAGPFQAWGWGEYKRERGWRPERWVAVDEDDATVACLQVLTKRLPFGRTLAWAPGGPLGGFPKRVPGAIGTALSEWLDLYRRDRHLVYARFLSVLPSSADNAYEISQICVRPRHRVTSGYTVALDLTRSLDDLKASMTAKHRYYVKRAEASDLRWRWASTDALAADLGALHAQMSRAKRLPVGGGYVGDVAVLRRTFADDSGILIGYAGTEPVTGCMVLIAGHTAFYLVAATGDAGRKISAAYAMVWQLLGLLKARGIACFDFGGLSPASPAMAGVDHFKRGFGGQVVEYLGEWEFASPRCLGALVGMLAARRAIR